MDKVQSYFTLIKRLMWKRDFLHKCVKAGSNLTVQGPIVCHGGGQIAIGDHLVVRATQHLPVEMFVASSATLEIGDSVFLNQGVRISCSQKITIGNNCLIADECVLLDNDFHSKSGETVKVAQITIEHNVWLAMRVIVLPGVTIGCGSCIGAGSVVTHSIPAGSFAAGAPARVIHAI